MFLKFKKIGKEKDRSVALGRKGCQQKEVLPEVGIPWEVGHRGASSPDEKETEAEERRRETGTREDSRDPLLEMLRHDIAASSNQMNSFLLS